MPEMSRRAEPADLYTVLRTPDLEEPVLLVHLEGWIDAGQSAAAAIAHVAGEIDAEPLVTFDTEWLLDHRARRPTMHVVEGVNTGLDWPSIEMSVGRDESDNDVLLLRGAEPDHNWRAFVDAIVELSARFGVRRMVGLGSYPAAAPHTRPARLSVTAATPELAAGDEASATLDVPAGIESAIELALHAAGIPALGLWAQVPHYVSASPYPAAILALVEGLRDRAGVQVDARDLAEQALTNRRRLDELVAGEPSHGEMLAELERRHDEAAETETQLPTSDELAAEVEQFLRDQGDDKDG
jgi:predicted ATP-grasp superfamily ATP-dependent carboligase